MRVHAIRGATQAEANEPDLILDATAELVEAVMVRNELLPSDVISVLFTTTPDLNAVFPAAAARAAGLGEVPLICATEIDVPGALPRVVRMLMHVETERRRSTVRHVYLRGAAALRLDLIG